MVQGTVNIKRMIKCPRHYIKNLKEDPFVREIVPSLKKVDNGVAREFGVKKYRIKRDRFGNPVINWKAFYQPEISAAFAIEHIWDPKNPICVNKCRGRCMRGMGKVVETGIRRLRG